MSGEHDAAPAAVQDLRTRLAADDEVQVIAFRLGGEMHACDVLMVQEVVTRGRVHPLPDMPPRLLGVLRLRGELIPVLDVAPLLDLSLAGGSVRGILIAESEVGCVGVATDGVHEVMQVPAGAWRPAPHTGRERDAFVLGVARTGGLFLTLIDLAEMLREQTTLGRGEAP